MRYAIVTRYLGPTNTKGSRVRAACDGASVTLSWEHRFSAEENHCAAATALCEKLGWSIANTAAGVLPNGCYVFVDTGYRA